jgi:hypothetical protein
MTPKHPSCYHTGYSLSCAEYDDLLSKADGRCMLCTAAAKLNIDHDHKLGGWAVRGLLCKLCNVRMRYIDAGTAWAGPAVAVYLANAWHLSQPSSAAKQARVKPRVDCPTCGYEVGQHRNGKLVRHWSRLSEQQGTICRGAPAS